VPHQVWQLRSELARRAREFAAKNKLPFYEKPRSDSHNHV
jgi:hypothetical protein